MPEIMEAGTFQSQLGNDLLVVHIGGMFPEVLARFIRENKTAVLLVLAISETVDQLLMPDFLQRLHNKGRHGDGAALSFFGGYKAIFTLTATDEL